MHKGTGLSALYFVYFVNDERREGKSSWAAYTNIYIYLIIIFLKI